MTTNSGGIEQARPRPRRGLLGVLILCPLLAACGELVRVDLGDADQHTPRDSLQREVDALALEAIAEGHTPGMVVGVLTPEGRREFFGYGKTGRDGRPPDADTLFEIGSISKLFAARLAVVLVREGMVSWDDDLGKLLPGAALSEDARKITLLDLATHTSGLPRQPNDLAMALLFAEYLFDGENFYRNLDFDRMLGYLAGFRAPARPGIEYSNLGYGLLGSVLARRAGAPLDSLVREKVLDPLGLKNTGYDPERLPGRANRAAGHAGDQPMLMRRGAPTPDWVFPEAMRATGGLYSSARDLLSFAAAYLPGGAARPAIAWVAEQVHGQEITYMFGVVGGYSTFIGIDAENRTAVVVLQNSLDWTSRVGQRLLVRLRAPERERQPARR